MVTRNRATVLVYSISAILRQTVLPTRLIIVDASDDHESILSVVRRCFDKVDVDCELIIVKHHAWQSAQRNEGVRHSKAPIIIFPDDDSVWESEAAECVIKTYEMDGVGVVGGVQMREIRNPPAELQTVHARQARQANFMDRLVYRFSNVKSRIFRVLSPNPMNMLGERLSRKHSEPEWVSKSHAKCVPYMLGFQMSFRSEVIRENPFNEQLATGRGFDDFDVSFAVLSKYVLMESTEAKVYHHRVGGGRAKARDTGITQLLNQAYIICRHTNPGDLERQILLRYARRLVVDYALRVHSEFGRERFKGIWYASRWVPKLIAAEHSDLMHIYRFAYNQCRIGKLPDK